MTEPRTLLQSIWDDHIVQTSEDGTQLLYVDRILPHEISSPQAFEALRAAGLKLRRPETVLGVAGHVSYVRLQSTASRRAESSPGERGKALELVGPAGLEPATKGL